MATFLRLASRKTCNLFSKSQINHLQKTTIACISTSKKNKDSVAVPADKISTKVTDGRLDEKEENWMSFGYDFVDREEDAFHHHLFMFVGIGVLCWGGFIMAYYPDRGDADWTFREAYLELDRREKAGLPLIDPNLVDPEKMNLPTDEELGDYEIIV